MGLISYVLCVIDVYIENQFLYFMKVSMRHLFILVVFVATMDVNIYVKRAIQS